MTRFLAFHKKNAEKQSSSTAGSPPQRRASSRNAAKVQAPSTAHAESSPIAGAPQDLFLNGNSRPHETSNGIQKHDTSIPAINAMSQSALLASKKDETYDSGQRRSIRRRLERQHEDDNAHLVINLCNIRKKLNFKENRPRDEQPPKKRQRRESIKCHCHLCIWDNTSGVDQADPIVRRTESCEVLPADERSSPEAGKFVELKLASPFLIRSKDLKIIREIKGEKQRVFSNQYFMEIKIIPNRSDEQWPPIPLLGKSEGDQTTKLGDLAADKLQDSLVARYQHLPQAPDSDTPLSLFYLNDGRTYRTKYGMEVKSIWTKADPETFKVKEESEDEGPGDWAYDDQKRLFGRELDPGVRRVAEKKPKREDQPVKVTYYLDPARAKGAPKEFRKCFLMGFRCPSCPGRKFEDMVKLQFHLMNMHHQYRFSLDEQLHDPITGNLASVMFKVESVEIQRPRNADRPKTRSDEDWEWKAPQEPFDLQRHVDGDHSWIGVQNKKKVLSVVVAPAKSDKLSDLRKANGGFLRAEDVPDFRPNNRKLHPNIKLRTLPTSQSIPYTSISHRQLGLDEDPRCETDDEMDNEWFVEKYMENLDRDANSEKWSPEERLLRKKWDRHLFKEKLPHSRYLSDSLVRFVKAEKPLLTNASPELMLAFVTMLEEMTERRIINNTVAEDVWDILMGPDSHRHQQQQKPLPGYAFVTEDDQQPLTCGRCRKIIKDQRMKALHCTDYHCLTPNQWYHAKCVGCKVNEKHSWKCEHCRNRKGKGKA